VINTPQHALGTRLSCLLGHSDSQEHWLDQRDNPERAKVFALKHFEVRFIRFGERSIGGFSSLGLPDTGL
jgi:hypothetical protein